MTRYHPLIALLLLLAFLPVTPLHASANDFTLEQVMSAPFPSDLIASHRGDKVAWIFYAEGKRNIWIAEAPAFKGRQLTRYNKDDGQEITAPVFSPDGNSIAYVRGGEPNGEGEYPNPTSDPLGARQEVWAVSTRTGRAVRIGEGLAPTFSPSSDRVIFSREGHLWEAPVLGGRAKKMFEIRGHIESPAWSPDKGSLAFVSVRADHSFIGVYEAQPARLRFLQPSVDRDIEPRWSPDGKQIAFIRSFNVDETLTADKERLRPWAIWVADAKSGRGKEIWRSGESETDSYSGVLDQNVLQWASNDRLVFGSESDGWAHLYTVSAEGGKATALTPGDYEVENGAWSPDRSFIIVSANASDIDRRHLWRVSLSGAPPQAVTRGIGIEMYPVIVDGGRQVAFLRSTARDPLKPVIASIDGSNIRPLAPEAMPPDYPSVRLVEPEQVIFKSDDGLEIHSQLFRPAGASGKLPAIVFMHGGPQRQMLLGWHYLYYYHNAYAMNQYLASRGYMVLSVNYRSGIGYGRAFREARHRGPRGASEYEDIVAAGKYLSKRGDVDAGRIGLWGGSYGGFLTAMGLARDSDLFAVGVDIHGVHDWSARVGRAPWATKDLIKLGRDSSPISSVDKWKSPVLFIHGDDDRNVDFSQTVDLIRELRKRDVQFEQLIFPDEIHDFLRHQTWIEVYRASADFFDRHLKSSRQ